MAATSGAARPVPEIRKLDESVVNRIAAGEVIQRPANAMKEMLENSLDAGATQVTITVKDGGLKLLQVQDNGHGIRTDDLPLLCERFATSKLRAFEDLATVGTLGFRGEALASISFVAHLTVTTMTHGAAHGVRATYTDGRLNGSPVPCASVPGTTMLVEDLFYNMPTRRKGLQSPGQEMARLLDVAGKYAVYKAGVAITCKRQGAPKPDLSTQPGASRRATLRAVYGAAVASDLLDLNTECGEWGEGEEGLPSELCVRAEGLVSGLSYHGKRSMLVLFLNGRPVDCSPLKRAIEGVYGSILPKNAKPFAFLDVRVPPRAVDVNVHPTKQEVAFLFQDALVSHIATAIEQLLSNANATHHIPTARVAPTAIAYAGQDGRGGTQGGGGGGKRGRGGASGDEGDEREGEGGRRGSGAGVSGKAPYRPNKLVRVDARSQPLEAFLHHAPDEGAVRAAGEGGTVRRPRRGMTAGGMGLATLLTTTTDVMGITEGATQGRGDGMEGGQMQGGGVGGGADGGGGDERAGGGGDASGAGAGAGAGAGGNAGAGAAALGELAAIRRSVRQRRGAGGESTQLTSVRELLRDAEHPPHPELSAVFAQCTLVGLIDPVAALAQHGTRLLVLDLSSLTRDLFFQLALRGFERHPRVRLGEGVGVDEAVEMALSLQHSQGSWSPPSPTATPAALAALARQLLTRKRDLLGSCFGIDITDCGRIVSLPLLLDRYHPDLDRLPGLVLDLATRVEWGEKACFRTIAEALADFYRLQPPMGEEGGGGEGGDDKGQHDKGHDEGQQGQGVNEGHEKGREGVALPGWRRDGRREWAVRHVVMPALRSLFKPPAHRGRDGTVVEVTRLEKLYQIFERC